MPAIYNPNRDTTQQWHTNPSMIMHPHTHSTLLPTAGVNLSPAHNSPVYLLISSSPSHDLLRQPAPNPVTTALQLQYSQTTFQISLKLLTCYAKVHSSKTPPTFSWFMVNELSYPRS